MCGHYFFSTGLFFHYGFKPAFSTYYFGELVFVFLYFMSFFRVMSFEFDVIFIELQHLYTIIVYVSANWTSVILFSLDENFLFAKIT